MKISLARASIRVDWRRNLSIIIILSLAGLILAGLIAWANGMGLASNNSILNSKGDLWVTKTVTQTWSGGSFKRDVAPTSEDMNLLWLHPDVVDVEPAPSRRGIRLDLPDASRVFTRVITIALDADALTYPTNVPASLATSLKPTYNIALPKNYANELNLAVGDTLVYSEDASMLVVEITDTVLNGSTPVVYMSDDTYQNLTGDANTRYRQVLVKIKDPSRAEQTRIELLKVLESMSPDMEVWTPAGFIYNLENEAVEDNELQTILSYIIGGFAFFIFMITNQLMRTNLYSQIKEFGALNALGISKKKLAVITMSQGFWIGVTSIINCTILYYILKYLATFDGQSLVMPTWGWWVSLGLIMGVAMVSGFLSIFVLRKIELTSLLR